MPPADDEKQFLRAFQRLPGQLVITNYRLLFVPHVAAKYHMYYNNQPSFVKHYFNVPLGYVSRCEKQVLIIQENQSQNQNYYNANQTQNFIEIYTKDGRYLKFHFTQAQNQLCAQVHAKIDRACFVDVGGHMQLS